jgi:WD40 repeat protein
VIGPPQLLSPEVYTYWVATSSDGSLLAAVPRKRPHTVEVFDTRTGRKLRVLTGSTGYVYGIAVEPGLVAASSGDRTVRVWSLATGKMRWVLSHGHPGGNIHALALSPDYRTLAIADSWYHLFLRDTRTGKRLASITQMDRIHMGISKLTWREDGRELVGVGDDEYVTRWPVPGLVDRRDQSAYPQVDYACDGKTMSWRNEEGVQVLDLPTGKQRTWPGLKEFVPDLITRDGRLALLSARHEQAGNNWGLLDLGNGHIVTRTGPQVRPLAFTQDGRTLLVQDAAGHIGRCSFTAAGPPSSARPASP